jgi:hypothetical protein
VHVRIPLHTHVNGWGIVVKMVRMYSESKTKAPQRLARCGAYTCGDTTTSRPKKKRIKINRRGSAGHAGDGFSAYLYRHCTSDHSRGQSRTLQALIRPIAWHRLFLPFRTRLKRARIGHGTSRPLSMLFVVAMLREGL